MTTFQEVTLTDEIMATEAVSLRIIDSVKTE